IHYDRNDLELSRGKFRVRGDVVECWPAYEEIAYRIELWGDEIETLSWINPLTGDELRREDQMYIYPAKHFVLPPERIEKAANEIQTELDTRLEELRTAGKLLEAQRLSARTRYDLELIRETGFCPGIENYSRALDGRQPGEPPSTLLDFFPDDFLLFIDEAHVTIPQVRGMFAGDHSRKTTLVEHGFRLPMALDNRPLHFDEFDDRRKQSIYVSATPGDWELERTAGEIVQQVIRPTGLLDPVLHVVPARGQVDHLVLEIQKRAAREERVLVTTLTKRLAEDLTVYFKEQGLKAAWLHSELDAIQRVTVLRELREKTHDVVVGINLLREGLDLPEVSLVAILDADKEGFLRSATSLIQTIGRSARHVNAEVILYADFVTNSMQKAIDETLRRRQRQLAYNTEHGITPESITKAIRRGIEEEVEGRQIVRRASGSSTDEEFDSRELLLELEAQMLAAAEELDFERAAAIRDRIRSLEHDAESPKASKRRSRAGGRRTRGPRLPKSERP
ncbi:MAG: helicase-related protein, partial [Planctomycetaceae bacterium]